MGHSRTAQKYPEGNFVRSGCNRRGDIGHAEDPGRAATGHRLHLDPTTELLHCGAHGTHAHAPTGHLAGLFPGGQAVGEQRLVQVGFAVAGQSNLRCTLRDGFPVDSASIVGDGDLHEPSTPLGAQHEVSRGGLARGQSLFGELEPVVHRVAQDVAHRAPERGPLDRRQVYAVRVHFDRDVVATQTVGDALHLPGDRLQSLLGGLVIEGVENGQDLVRRTAVAHRTGDLLGTSGVHVQTTVLLSHGQDGEALTHAGLFHDRDIDIRWVASEDIENDGSEAHLSGITGIVVPGGFGYRGVEGMIDAVRYARENRIPYLGLCLGMQVMVIEAARNLLGKEDANSTEFNQDTNNPVIDLMPDQVGVTDKGGTMRLGVYPCEITGAGVTSKAYAESDSVILERHRHRFEFNNSFRDQLAAVGLMATGLSPDGSLVEIVEHDGHPFMAGTQFHPEFLSRPSSPHPMFKEFIRVACESNESDVGILATGNDADGADGTNGTSSEKFVG